MQPNADTRRKQLDAWCSLILSYCKHHKIHELDVAEVSSSELFHNQSIQSKIEFTNWVLKCLNFMNFKFSLILSSVFSLMNCVVYSELMSYFALSSGKLDPTNIVQILDALVKQGHVEWHDPRKKSCLIMWRTPEEWGKLIFEWVWFGLLNSIWYIIISLRLTNQKRLLLI